jgi:Cdc6-like AAA superfamily ATPase
MIRGLNRDQFEGALKRTLSPTTPIRSSEYLRGREKKLEDIRRSLLQPGRHIFIYGDRGVGKTSLAQTAAFEHQKASNSPIFLGCDASSTFPRLAQELSVRLIGNDPTITRKTVQHKGVIGWPSFLGGEKQKAVEQGQVPEPRSVNDAVTLVAHAVERHSDNPVIVVDEFERIQDHAQRMLFADFIKQAGDQSIPIKLIFCGVGSSLDQLLDAHHSCYRYLASIELERLAFQPRLEIIEKAAAAVGVQIEAGSRYRVAAVSDGFPHYVHLITEKLLWQLFDDPVAVGVSSTAHYVNAVRAAVQDIEPKLKASYEAATLKYSDSDEYEGVLWAVADHHELKRRSSDIFDLYRALTREAKLKSLSRDKFNQRINALKGDAHGAILEGTRQGWYSFREPVMRGYVRLRAEAKGVELGADHPEAYRGPGRLRGHSHG